MPAPILDASEQERRKAAGCDGCRLWGDCGGERAVTGDPYPDGHKHAGKPRWRTPVVLPRLMPEGEQAHDRRIRGCPSRATEPWMGSALATWSAARAARTPVVPDLDEADPRLLRACQILDYEADLINMRQAEDARRRAKMGGGHG